MGANLTYQYRLWLKLCPVLKVNRMMEIAFENDLPLISLVQSVSSVFAGSTGIPPRI